MRYSTEKTQPFIFHQYVQIIKVGLILLFTMMCFRFFFIFKFTDLVQLKKNLNLTGESLFLGLRFDLSVVAHISALPLLISSIGLAFSRERYLYFIPYFNRFWLFGSFLILLAILIFDINHYAFFNEHLNSNSLSLFSDTFLNILHKLSRNYALALWIPVMVLEIFVFWLIFKRLFRRERIDLFYAQPIGREGIFGILISIIFVIFFLARGNFSENALSLDDAKFSSSDSINELSVNGVLAFNRAWRSNYY